MAALALTCHAIFMYPAKMFKLDEVIYLVQIWNTKVGFDLWNTLRSIAL